MNESAQARMSPHIQNTVDALSTQELSRLVRNPPVSWNSVDLDHAKRSLIQRPDRWTFVPEELPGRVGRSGGSARSDGVVGQAVSDGPVQASGEAAAEEPQEPADGEAPA